MFAVQSHVELAAFHATKEDSATITDPNAKSIFARSAGFLQICSHMVITDMGQLAPAKSWVHQSLLSLTLLQELLH